MYQCSVMEEAGHHRDALTFIDKHDKDIVDRLSYEETRARLLILLGDKDSAAGVYRGLSVCLSPSPSPSPSLSLALPLSPPGSLRFPLSLPSSPPIFLPLPPPLSFSPFSSSRSFSPPLLPYLPICLPPSLPFSPSPSPLPL